jgi:hypothetical protein
MSTTTAHNNDGLSANSDLLQARSQADALLVQADESRLTWRGAARVVRV